MNELIIKLILLQIQTILNVSWNTIGNEEIDLTTSLKAFNEKVNNLSSLNIDLNFIDSTGILHIDIKDETTIIVGVKIPLITRNKYNLRRTLQAALSNPIEFN